MLEKLMFKKVELWIVGLLILVGGIVALLFAWAASQPVLLSPPARSYAKKIARLPNPVMEVLFGRSQPQLLNYEVGESIKPFAKGNPDPPYVLVSAYSDRYEVSTAYLYDLKANKKRYEWVPPVDQIDARTTPNPPHVSEEFRTIRNKGEYRTQHPILTTDGSLIFTSGEGPLVKIDRCNRLEWTIDRHFHHSIMRGPSGDFFVPIISKMRTTYKPLYGKDTKTIPLRNDGFARVSPEGEILREWSVVNILIKNGYGNLLLGIGQYEIDRIHLNDVQPIIESDGFVHAGDLVLSIRNLSSVLLYRPSTGKVIWLQTGPWLNQHDVDYEGSGRFTIFGNDYVRSFGSIRGYSTIWQYDMTTGKASELLPLKKYGIYSETQGEHAFLRDGRLFVESTDQGTLYLLNPDGDVAWKYVSPTSRPDTIGALHWSRVIARHYGDQVLRRIEKQGACS